MKLIVILVILGLAFQGYAEGSESLSCFQCHDCAYPFNRDADNVQTVECSPEPEPEPEYPTSTTEGPITSSTTVSTTTGPTTTTEPTTTGPTTTTEPTTTGPTTTTGKTTTGPTTTEKSTVSTSSTTTTTTTTEEAPIEGPPTFARSRYRREEGSDNCFVTHHQNGDQRIISRGCVRVKNTKTLTCAAASGTTEYTHCALCNSDECNSAAGVAASIFTVITGLLIVMRFR